MSLIDTALTIGKFIPGINVPCSAISAVKNLLHGDFLKAGCDLLGMLPIVGGAIGGVAKLAEGAGGVDAVAKGARLVGGINSVAEKLHITPGVGSMLRAAGSM